MPPTRRPLARRLVLLAPLLVALAIPAAAPAQPAGGPAAGDPRRELEALLAQQAAAWSRGDIDAFCSVYAEDALFLSPSGVTRGRQAVLDRYRKRYPDRAAMGTLSLEPIEVRLGGSAGADAAECGGTLLDRMASLAGAAAGGIPAAVSPGGRLPAVAPQGEGLPVAASQGEGLPVAASIAARWKLTYPDKPPAEGLTLLVFHRRDGRWWIVQDASM